MRNIGVVGATCGLLMHYRWMARYYFNLRNDMSVDDPEGQELPDLDAARKKAEIYALDMIAATVVKERKLHLHHRIEVTDEAGKDVLTVEFGDVLSVVR